MTPLIIRAYRPSDANAVSRLFQEVYGDHYAQPDVYLPNMINQHNAEEATVSASTASPT